MDAQLREDVRKFVWKLLILPATALSILTFILGYVIRQGAEAAAYNKALTDAQSKIQEFTANAATAAANATHANNAAQDAQTRLQAALKSIESLSATLVPDIVNRLKQDPDFSKNLNIALGTTDTGIIVPPDGTTDKWDIVVIPLEYGVRDKSTESEIDNALLSMDVTVTPDPNKTHFIAAVTYGWKAKNKPTGITTKKSTHVSYILRRKTGA